MVYLYNKSTGDLLGEISEADLQYLIDQMEEESTKDQDYSITSMELAYFREHGASSELISILSGALEGKPEVIILWSRSRE